jgi:hypothetical protein
MSSSDRITCQDRFAPVGSLVLSGYWGAVDLVLEHVCHADWRGESVRVVEVEHPAQRGQHFTLGRVREHSTDMRGDVIVGTVEPSVVASYLREV